ncbi:pyocin knob domain-containing protein [Lactococcus nasutitermitis]|uniref:Pyocin knob domain-containing protein n=1 Tax=Lactococcus nasutitermitis TaxID=1652957 RepID=A0ABV9JFA4_9LACT|nr:pyocin knob domain-containing protein [Lactococcus nasutitermitis]
MSIWAFPLKSINGSNAYGPQDFMQFYANLYRTGIIPTVPIPGATAFQVVSTIPPSLNVTVGAGAAIMGSFGQLMNTAPLSLPIPVPLTNQPRTDSVVLQLSLSSNTAGIIYKENSTQVVQTADTYELQLAIITVPANATSISQANITDMRADETVCGYSSPFEQIETGDLLAQFKAELEANGIVFSEWFDKMKGQLSEDAAGNLQNQINETIHNAGNISSGTDLNNINGVGYYRIGGLVGGTDVLNAPSETNGIRFYAFLTVTGSLQELTVYSPKNETTWTYSRSISGSPATWSSWSKTVMADDTGKVTVKDLQISGTLKQATDVPWTNLTAGTGVLVPAGAFLKYQIKNGYITIVASNVQTTIDDNGQKVLTTLPVTLFSALTYVTTAFTGNATDSWRVSINGTTLYVAGTAGIRSNYVSFSVTLPLN